MNTATSDNAPVQSRTSRPRNGNGGYWILLYSLLLGGANVQVGSRTPVLLYFDIVLLGWLAYYVYWRGFWPRFSGWVLRLGMAFLLLEILSALVNYRDIYKSLAAVKVFACGLLVYAIARKAPPTLSSLSIWGAAVGILLLRNYRNIQIDPYLGLTGLKDEVVIALGASNYVASILLLVIPIAVAEAAIHRGAKRALFAVSAALMLGGLAVTMSRGAIMALVLAPLLCLPLLYRAGLRIRHAAVGLLLVGVTLTLLPSDLLQLNAAIIVFRWNNPDLSREELLKASWASFKENPVLGVGPGQLGNAIAQRITVPDYNWQHVNAHNLILNSLAENGIFGGLILLLIVGMVLWSGFRLAAAHPTPLNVALLVALFAAIIHNMVEASFEGQQFQVVFWTMAAMVTNYEPDREGGWASDLAPAPGPRSSLAAAN